MKQAFLEEFYVNVHSESLQHTRRVCLIRLSISRLEQRSKRNFPERLKITQLKSDGRLQSLPDLLRETSLLCRSMTQRWGQ